WGFWRIGHVLQCPPQSHNCLGKVSLGVCGCGMQTVDNKRTSQVESRRGIRVILRERCTIEGNRRVQARTEPRLWGGWCGCPSPRRAVEIDPTGTGHPIKHQGQLPGEGWLAPSPCLVRLQSESMVTCRQVMDHLTTGEEGAEVFKRLDGLRV